MPTTYFVRIIIIIKNPYVFFKGFAKIKTSKAFWQSQGQRSCQNSIDKICSNIKEKIVSFRWLRKEATRNKTDDISSFSFSYMIVFSMNLGWISRSKLFRRSQTLASNLVILFISWVWSRPEYSSKNPESVNDWNSESKFHWQRLISGTWKPEFPYTRRF